MSIEVGVDEIVVDVSVPVVDVSVDVTVPVVEILAAETTPVEIDISDAIVAVSVSNPSVVVDVVDASVDVILSGPPGKEGTIILNGELAPTPDLGRDGYYYLDTTSDVLYGPKLDLVWPIAMNPPGEVLNHELKSDPHPQYLDAVPVYTHYQSVLASVWVVAHSMGKYPLVVVEDGGGAAIFGSIIYTDLNQLTITFASGVTGRAYCT